MSCSQVEWLHGYFDGELDAARAAEFEAHLAGCASCAAELARQQALRDAIAGAALYARATPGFRARVGALLPRRGAARLRVLVWPGVTAAAILAGLGWLSPAWNRGSSERALVGAILDSHLRSLQAGHLTDVVSSDQHTVKPWFDGKLDLSPPVKDLTSEGFPLIGGRLDVVAGRTVAALVYGRRKHVVSVFVWGAEGGEASSVRSGTSRGYHWIHWNRNGLTLWAISDAAADDLEEFARRFEG